MNSSATTFRRLEGLDSNHPNHSHAWRGAWDRPMHIDEDSHHPFTIARMTDHNVRGVDGHFTSAPAGSLPVITVGSLVEDTNLL